ncbi:hypothetical protein BCR43DRAFT_484384 [Syncephalastrum racemosum]|uniref:Uncharacterized protein n=1 Tax=Syncephalastrum racemosum TaxID=13706 RepID=A0A1X2HWR4_SYNRA|nr:hypothetical protein BCR43DRAFT_484384 [Syncephalastrum racemosum]
MKSIKLVLHSVLLLVTRRAYTSTGFARREGVCRRSSGGYDDPKPQAKVLSHTRSTVRRFANDRSETVAKACTSIYISMDAYFDFLDDDILILAKATETEIGFFFGEQYFLITADEKIELEFVLYKLDRMLRRFMPKRNSEELTETTFLTVTEIIDAATPS